MNEELVSRLRFMKKALGVGAIVLGGLICFCILIYALFGTTSKTPVTSEHLWEVLVSHGYEPTDVTDTYTYEDAAYLNRCFGFEKDDLHFEFYDYNNKASAKNKSMQMSAYLANHKKGYPYQERNTFVKNYSIYSLVSSGKYYVAIWVENTAVYAYCDEENAPLLGEIFSEIGYTN